MVGADDRRSHGPRRRSPSNRRPQVAVDVFQGRRVRCAASPRRRPAGRSGSADEWPRRSGTGTRGGRRRMVGQPVGGQVDLVLGRARVGHAEGRRPVALLEQAGQHPSQRRQLVEEADAADADACDSRPRKPATMSGASKTQFRAVVVSLPGKRRANGRGCLPGVTGVGRNPAKNAAWAAKVKLPGVCRFSQPRSARPPPGAACGRRHTAPRPRRTAACRASRTARRACRSAGCSRASRVHRSSIGTPIAGSLVRGSSESLSGALAGRRRLEDGPGDRSIGPHGVATGDRPLRPRTSWRRSCTRCSISVKCASAASWVAWPTSSRKASRFLA